MNKNQNIALVLSGGGARGLAHIGVIERLVDQGYTISSIAGTSIGSLIGAIHISGKLPQFKKWITKRGKLDIIRLMDFAISNNGFIKGEKVFGELNKYVVDSNIEDLNIPYAAVATDIRRHTEFVFTRGRLIDAIRASVAIPTVLKPFEKDGIELVDGGVLNPLPLDIVSRMPGDLMVAVDLNADFEYEPPEGFLNQTQHNKTYEKAITYINDKWSGFFKNGKHKRTGFFDLITQSIFAMQLKLTQVAIEKHKPDIVISISKNACDLFEFHRAAEMIEYGRIQTEKNFN